MNQPNFRALGAKIVELWDADCDIDVEINELRELLATPLLEPPMDEELWAFWNNHDGPIPAILRAALERWGR